MDFFFHLGESVHLFNWNINLMIAPTILSYKPSRGSYMYLGHVSAPALFQAIFIIIIMFKHNEIFIFPRFFLPFSLSYKYLNIIWTHMQVHEVYDWSTNMKRIFIYTWQWLGKRVTTSFTWPSGIIDLLNNDGPDQKGGQQEYDYDTQW